MLSAVQTIQSYPVLYWLVKFLTRASVAAAVLWALYLMISHMSPGAKQFWTGVFSDGGVPSSSRVLSTVITVVGLFWISYIVIVTKALPDVNGVALLIGTPYGINVAGKAAEKFTRRDGEDRKEGDAR